MSIRTRQQTVTFQNEFRLSGIEEAQPPGSYVVEIEEELMTELSFPAYRRTATVIGLASSRRGRREAAIIDPLELDAALERDSALNAIVAAPAGPAIQAAAGPSSAAAPSFRSSLFLFSERLRKAAIRGCSAIGLRA